MNGTHVNGKKCGGREKGETPEQGAKRQYPSIDLKHGDRITVGQSSIEVRIKAAPDAPGVRQVNAALPEGGLSGLSPEAMQQLIVAAASRRRPCKGRPALSLLENYHIKREMDVIAKLRHRSPGDDGERNMEKGFETPLQWMRKEEEVQLPCIHRFCGRGLFHDSTPQTEIASECFMRNSL
jgi:hypothetical protein